MEKTTETKKTARKSSLQEKILAVQTELKAPKDKYNSFGKYSYRSAEGILEAVKPLLKGQGILLCLTDDVVAIGDRIYVKATASITDGEEVFAVSAFAREEEVKKGMDGSQITGTASSYARKYALNGLFLIDDTKDADTDEYHEQTTVGRATPKIDIDAYLRAVDDLKTANAVQLWWSANKSSIPNDIVQTIYQACKEKMKELSANN